MSTPEQPPRLIAESSGASAELRRALGAARGDLPSPEHVEAMLARFPYPDGGGGGPSDGGGGAEITAEAAAKSAAIGKWAGIAFLAVSAGTAFYAETKVAPHAPPQTASAVVSASAGPTATAVVTAPAPEPTGIASSAPTASAIMSSAPRVLPLASMSAPSATASASSPSEPVRSEIEILKEAQASRGNPARMLELVNEHAKSHPKGVLGQEREMLRIEALVGLGKRAEAKALADAFRKGNPGSAYTERLNQIVPP